ncbi:aromatic amino acid ammonia-lyase [Cloacibacillus sp. An23]|uniref:HAL/PAL/TAL family ammonia-lyase n=1 Tax=Cloacibacillus sp. An23 TaxID=1965591 RepID=UPI000B3A9B3F|nr:aromatic amino acid ammonia-lyase [Cloacibacillus sp. An23]OUO94402.1 phenylalanine ammonia-lyase [Cloacibacillus sp. An23]
MALETIVLDGHSLTLDEVCAVACGKAAVEISPSSAELLAESRKLVFELSNKGIPIYGCNRGVGWNKDKKVTKEFIAQFNSNMMHSHAVGVGPYLSKEEARAAVVVRLNNLLCGCTGLSPEIAFMMRDMLNRDIVPLIPSKGSVGEADIVNLSHLGLALMGEGKVFYKDGTAQARDAFREEGLSPITLAEKDGLAVLSSNALSAGLACSVLASAKNLLDSADLIAGMSLEALNGNVSALREGAHKVRRYPKQIETAARMRKYLKNSYLYESDPERPLQDPLSFRCVPQVHGAVRTALAYAAENLEIHLNSSDDNPCLLMEERDITSCGNFDPLCWVLGVENLGVAMSHVSKLSCLRSIKLASPNFTKLSRHLTPDDSTIAFSTIQKIYANMDAEIRLLAAPISMDTFALAGDMEDICTNAPLVMQKTKRILECLFYVLAIELIHAGQAMDLRGARYGETTSKGLAALRKVMPFYGRDDRVLSDDIENVRRLLESGDFLKEALGL